MRPTEQGKTKQKRKYDCDFCGKCFLTIPRLKAHVKTHIEPDDMGRQHCPVCAKHFVLPVILLMHIRVHLGIKPYRCRVCGKRSAISSIIRAHMKTHLGDTPYTCDRCGVGFKEVTALNEHTRRHLTVNNPHVCELCSESFPRISQFKAHLATHYVNRPHRCGICPTRFATRVSLESHKLTHSQGSSPWYDESIFKSLGDCRPPNCRNNLHKCSVCQKTFPKHVALLGHKRSHQEHKTRKRRLFGIWKSQRSQNTNANKKNKAAAAENASADREGIKETSYKCDVCGKKFSHNCALMGHKRSHGYVAPWRISKKKFVD